MAHIVLPLVLAGLARTATRSSGTSGIAATALAIAVLGAFSPPLMVLALVAALVIAVRGSGSARLRGLALLLVPLALLGPWLTALAGDWRLLLSGPGLGVRGGVVPAPWQAGAAAPGRPGVVVGAAGRAGSARRPRRDAPP